jgi:pyruvate ferredoxin oxidoreductase gamma subunit
MAKMTEIRFHGRGGQGAKTAADLLATTSLETGKFIQSFPEYGPERAGAPIRSFTRISEEPINLHCGITNPDMVVVIDPTLLESVNVSEGLDENGILLVNTEKTPEVIRKKINFNKGKVFTVDATRISLETLGLPLPNTPMLGALIKATGIVALDSLKSNVRSKFLKKIGEAKVKGNLDSIDRAYKEVIGG